MSDRQLITAANKTTISDEQQTAAKKRLEAIFANVRRVKKFKFVPMDKGVVEEAVALLIEFPELAGEIQHNYGSPLNFPHAPMIPVFLLAFHKASLVQIKELVKLHDPPDDMFESLLHRLSSYAYPDVLLFLFQTYPRLKTNLKPDDTCRVIECLIGRYRNDCMENKQHLEALMCGLLDRTPNCLGWNVAHTVSNCRDLSDAMIDKIVQNLSEPTQSWFRNLWMKETDIATVRKILPKMTRLKCIDRPPNRPEVAIGLLDSIVATGASSLCDISLAFPRDLVKQSSLLRQSVQSMLAADYATLKRLLLICIPDHTGNDNIFLEEIGNAFGRRSSVIPCLELECFQVTNMNALDSILASPTGSHELTLRNLSIDLQPCPSQATLAPQTGSRPSLKKLKLSLKKEMNETSFCSLLELVSQLGTLASLALDFTHYLMKQPVVLQQIISLLDRNKQLDNLCIYPFPRAALDQLWKALGTGDSYLRSLKIGLDFSTTDNEVLRASDEASIETHARNNAGIKPDGKDRVYFETGLAELLRGNNATLQNCKFDLYMDGDLNKACFSPDLCHAIEYYLNLNGYGRKKARDCSKQTLVILLSRVMHDHTADDSDYGDIGQGFLGHPLFDTETDIGHKNIFDVPDEIRKVRYLYGLLRESPLLWAKDYDDEAGEVLTRPTKRCKTFSP